MTQTEQVAIRPAATVMLIDDRPDLQVFMMERHANNVFGPGMWVFPGGSVDNDDDSSAVQSVSIHRSDQQASSLLGLSKGGLAFYVAAIRESFEEAGILLALSREQLLQPDLSEPTAATRFQQHRDALNSREQGFVSILQEEDLVVDAGAMHYVARWITPPGSPRRFDARFFVARIPANQTPIHDDQELVHSRWMSPQEVLKRFTTNEMQLMSPTLRMIKNLAQFRSAGEVMEAAAANLSDERARLNQDTNLIVMPGEPGYDTATENVESGWIRLRPL